MESKVVSVEEFRRAVAAEIVRRFEIVSEWNCDGDPDPRFDDEAVLPRVVDVVSEVFNSLLGPDTRAVVGSEFVEGDRAKARTGTAVGTVTRVVLSLDFKPERGATRAVVASLMERITPTDSDATGPDTTAGTGDACMFCGTTDSNAGVEYMLDPLSEAVSGDNSPCWICTECYNGRMQAK